MLCNIEYLKLHEESNIDEEVVKLRGNYALFANMLFLPFRELEDLKNDEGLFWGKFKQAFNATEEEQNDSISMNGSTFWQYGKKILQNIQDRITNWPCLPPPLASNIPHNFRCHKQGRRSVPRPIR